MQFYYSTQDVENVFFNDFSSLEPYLDSLKDNKYSFVRIESKPNLHNVAFMQVTYIRETKGIFRKKLIDEYYQVEIEIIATDGKLNIYAYFTKALDEVKSLLEKYCHSESVPNYDTWEHIIEL